MSFFAWTSAPTGALVQRLDTAIAKIHHAIHPLLFADTSQDQWRQLLKSISPELKTLADFHRANHSDYTLPAVFSDVVVSASVLAYKAGIKEFTSTWQMPKQEASQLAPYTNFSFTSNFQESYLKEFLVTEPTPLRGPATPSSPKASSTRVPELSPGRATVRDSVVANIMGQYGSRSPEVPKSFTKHVASTSAASTKAKAKSSAAAPAPSSGSRSRPQPSRPAAPVAGSSRRPAVPDVPLEISDDEPTAELPPKRKAAKRRAPPPVVDEDADYNPEVDAHDDIQEEIREVPPPRPSEQQMVFSDDEREGVPLHRPYVLVLPMPLQPMVIKADVQGKLRGAQEFGEASELALLGRDGRSCSFWRIARSHRACGAHIPGARCTNCDNRRNNL
ncbi:hypothetical protein V5O48_018911, partial [Marasmius crinis-equi]